MSSRREKILNYLRETGKDADDDELSVALGIIPRQSVNQICRCLEREGLVIRVKDPIRRKIVNRLAGEVRDSPPHSISNTTTTSAEAIKPTESSTANLTAREQDYLNDARSRVLTIKRLLDEHDFPEVTSPVLEWYVYLSEFKKTLGNFNNVVSFVATLMAKDYLSQRLRMQPFDVAAKAQGAPGLDIDETTEDGKRVVGEIKSTFPYLDNDLGAQQKAMFKKDFAKLNNADADYKFFFLLPNTQPFSS